jgi:hypothetical protein
MNVSFYKALIHFIIWFDGGGFELNENNGGRISLMWGLALLISLFGASAQLKRPGIRRWWLRFDWGSYVLEKEAEGTSSWSYRVYGEGRNDAG